MIRPRSAAAASAVASPLGTITMSSSSVGGAESTLLEVDPLRLVVALDDAPDEELDDRRGVPASDPLGRSPTQIARRSTLRPPSRRSIVAPSRWTVSRSIAAASPAAATTTRRTGSSPAAARVALVALRGQLAEGGERLQLTAGSPIELAERAVEGDGSPTSGIARTSAATSHG